MKETLNLQIRSHHWVQKNSIPGREGPKGHCWCGARELSSQQVPQESREFRGAGAVRIPHETVEVLATVAQQRAGCQHQVSEGWEWSKCRK